MTCYCSPCNVDVSRVLLGVRYGKLILLKAAKSPLIQPVTRLESVSFYSAFDRSPVLELTSKDYFKTNLAVASSRKSTSLNQQHESAFVVQMSERAREKSGRQVCRTTES